MGRSPTFCQNTDKSKVCNWIDKGDERLNDCVQMHGEACRRSVSKAAGTLRCGKSCRRRWTSRLRPHLKRGSFAEDEDELIIKLHALLGNRWSLIAGRLPGRTDNEIKNYWNVHLKRELHRRGVDPQTHRPIQQNPRHPSSAFVDLSSTQSQSKQVSDAASSSTEEHPTLNLKLSMGSLPSTCAAPAERDLGNVNTTNEVHSGGRTAINDGFKGLIKPVCHRVSQVMPRTLLLLR